LADTPSPVTTVLGLELVAYWFKLTSFLVEPMTLYPDRLRLARLVLTF
jgi:hypothetical protein